MRLTGLGVGKSVIFRELKTGNALTVAFYETILIDLVVSKMLLLFDGKSS